MDHQQNRAEKKGQPVALSGGRKRAVVKRRPASSVLCGGTGGRRGVPATVAGGGYRQLSNEENREKAGRQTEKIE